MEIDWCQNPFTDPDVKFTCQFLGKKVLVSDDEYPEAFKELKVIHP